VNRQTEDFVFLCCVVRGIYNGVKHGNKASAIVHCIAKCLMKHFRNISCWWLI